MTIKISNTGQKVYESEEYGSAYWHNEYTKEIEWCPINEDGSYDMGEMGSVEVWDETDKKHICKMLGVELSEVTN